MWAPQLSGAFHLPEPGRDQGRGNRLAGRSSRCQGGCPSEGPAPFPHHQIPSQTLSLIPRRSSLVPFSFLPQRSPIFSHEGSWGRGSTRVEMGWKVRDGGGTGFERHCLRLTHSRKGMNSECGVPAAQHFGVWVVGQGARESRPSPPPQTAFFTNSQVLVVLILRLTFSPSRILG